MCGIQVTLPLQIVIRLMVTGHVGTNATLSLIPKPVLAQTTDLRVLPSGYVSFPEYGAAYKLSKTMLSYDEAREMCLKENGQLAVIDSTEKIKKVFDQYDYFIDVWVGIRKSDDTGEWTTIDGKPIHKFKPINKPFWFGHAGKNKNCAYILRLSNEFFSMRCDAKKRYLCEIALPRN